MPKKKPSRAEIEAVANGTAAARSIWWLTQAGMYHAHELDKIEFDELLDLGTEQLESAKRNPVWRPVVQRSKAPERSSREETLEWFRQAAEFGSNWLNTALGENACVDSYLNGAVRRLVKRTDEIRLFECRFPRNKSVAEYDSPERFHFLLWKYMEVYGSILKARASFPSSGESHLLDREIAELKTRMDHCSRLASKRSFADEYLAERGLVGSLTPTKRPDPDAFSLTQFEQEFLEHVKRKLRLMRQSQDTAEEKTKSEAGKAASAVKPPGVTVDPTSISGADVCRQTVKLSPEEEKEFARWGFKSRLPVVITGHVEGLSRNVVIVAGKRVLLTNLKFRLFLRLVQELTKGNSGWVSKRELKERHFVGEENDYNRKVHELRNAFEPALEGYHLSKKDFIQAKLNHVRLSTHLKYISNPETEGKTRQAFAKKLSELIRSLPKQKSSLDAS
jgi:hypothetical protein